ncbi:VOC family protein [Streptomyces sp. CRN 30]|uniref:VOC family protein n=1 Tax=Streptomyces sp. CRN 30 TaxID=3075613 RepID=UPI002A7EAF40|nr:VOC family protein [Streptomyces sp. CRN 30]
MTTRPGSANESWPDRFCWMDLKTHDTAGTAAFLSDVLGWRFAVDEEDWRKAVKISAGGRRIGGVSDLASPVYPPGIPAHIAYYLATDDVDRRTQTATANGARVLVPPFDVGDQGRIATLADPTGAAFSLWRRPGRSLGWHLPSRTPAGPRRMVLACEHPGRARDFYRRVTGAPLPYADFVTVSGTGTGTASGTAAPQWELAVGVDDLEDIAARVRAHGRGSVTRLDGTGVGGTAAGITTDTTTRPRPTALRLSSPEGLTLRVELLEGGR